jgi:anti-anti-sigma factor
MDAKDVTIEISNIAGNKDTKLVKIAGVLDTLTSPKVDETIGPLVNDGKPVVVDFRQVSYMNSTGLALLLKYAIQAKRRDTLFKIVGPNRFVHEVMDVSGAAKMLDLHQDIEGALNGLT